MNNKIRGRVAATEEFGRIKCEEIERERAACRDRGSAEKLESLPWGKATIMTGISGKTRGLYTRKGGGSGKEDTRKLEKKTEERRASERENYRQRKHF